MPAAWPTAADLQTWLYAAGLIAANPPTGQQASLGYTGALAAALEELEAVTGISPFLAEAGPTTRYYDPDCSRIVSLGTAWYTVTAVATGYSPTYAGNALTVNVDYWLRGPARNAAPYTYIEFRDHQTGDPGSIAVTGRRGYGATVPQAAWDALLASAGLRLLPSLERLSRGGVVERQSGDEREKYGTGERDAWQAQVKAAYAAYRLTRIA